MKKFLFVLLFTLSILVISCGEDTQENDQNNNCDCKSWEVCIDNECKLAEGKCNDKNDCSEGQICNDNHICQTENNNQCTSDKECPSDKPVCDNGTCVEKQEESCIFGHKEGDTCIANQEAFIDMGVTTGTYPNDILLYDNALFIINSGDNAIQKIELTDGPTNHNPYISLEEMSNPYYMTLFNDELFITNLMGNSYSRVKLNDTENVKTVSFDEDNALKGPEGIAVNDNNIFITNTNSYWDNETSKMVYGEGFITVINKSDDTFAKKIVTTQKNPQKTFIFENKLYVINSGTSEADENWVMYPKSNGGIDVFDLDNENFEADNTVIPYNDGKLSGFPGSYSIDEVNKVLYIASGTAPEIYAYDLKNSTMLRNTDNPIVVDSFDPPVSTLLNLAVVENYLFVINFNNDNLYVLDINDNYKKVLQTNIGEDPDNMEGPQGIVYDKENKKIYIFFGISKKLMAIDIQSL